jgi:nucleotide-binding universal stress UspA family protein
MPHPGNPDSSAHRDSARSAILVGVDGSAAARAAIAAAAREASYRSAPLIAIRAYSGEQIQRGERPPGVSALDPAAGRPSADEDRRAAESSLRDTVRDVLGAERAARVQVRAVLGLAGRKIVETALQVNAQLIVLATHGSRSMLMGTVSQYVLRKAPCPVLIVPAQPAGH